MNERNSPTEQILHPLEAEMDEKFFGFGHWKAPYWFIGPEQGKGVGEAAGNASRAEAWKNLGSPEVCDLLKFHRLIPDLTWHTKGPRKPRLQSTWRSLILALLAMQGKPFSIEARREYQSDYWGRETGETCVIELSGTASSKLRGSEHRAKHLQARIAHIRCMIEEHKPQAVLMYGLSEVPSWNEIAGQPLKKESPVTIGKTTFAYAPHTNDRGRSNEDWIRLGRSFQK